MPPTLAVCSLPIQSPCPPVITRTVLGLGSVRGGVDHYSPNISGQKGKEKEPAPIVSTPTATHLWVYTLRSQHRTGSQVLLDTPPLRIAEQVRRRPVYPLVDAGFNPFGSRQTDSRAQAR